MTEFCNDNCLCDQVAIDIKDLSIRYGDKQALQAVSTRINPCGITALIGPSGCGKTSFLSSLNRMTDTIKQCKLEGEIILGELRVLTPSFDVRRLRQHVGMIFQKPNPFPISIAQNIILPLKDRGTTDKQQLDAIVEQCLKQVGLWQEVKDRLTTPALELSGGQQQRLCIARTLALKPQVILFDEPCSALDPIASAVVEDLIKQLGKQYTVVIVTHNLAQAKRIADDVCFFWLGNNGGTIIEQGKAHDVFNNPQDPLTKAYIAGDRG